MNKIKELWKLHRREIFIGIIVSIITTVLWNAVTWFVKETPKVGANIFESIRNVYYHFAAIHTESSASEMVFSLLIGLMFGVFGGFTPIFARFLKYRSKKEYGDLENKSNENVEITKYEKEKLLKNEEKLKNTKLQYRLLTSFIILVIFTFIIVTSFVIIPADIYKKFNRDITMISPYVENHKIIQLKSKWVLMKEYNDYKEIYITIDEIKDKNNLPK